MQLWAKADFNFYVTFYEYIYLFLRKKTKLETVEREVIQSEDLWNNYPPQDQFNVSSCIDFNSFSASKLIRMNCPQNARIINTNYDHWFNSTIFKGFDDFDNFLDDLTINFTQFTSISFNLRIRWTRTLIINQQRYVNYAKA